MVPGLKVVGRFFVCLENKNGQLVAGKGNRIAKLYWPKEHNCEARKLYVSEKLGADRIESGCWSENKNSFLSLKSHGFEFVEEILEIRCKRKRPATFNCRPL